MQHAEVAETVKRFHTDIVHISGTFQVSRTGGFASHYDSRILFRVGRQISAILNAASDVAGLRESTRRDQVALEDTLQEMSTDFNFLRSEMHLTQESLMSVMASIQSVSRPAHQQHTVSRKQSLLTSVIIEPSSHE